MPIRKYRNWNSKEPDDVVCLAQKSIDIVTTWPADIRLGEDILKACSLCKKNLKVTIYIADPEGEFAPRRVAERVPDFERTDYLDFPRGSFAREHAEIVRYKLSDLGTRLNRVDNLDFRVFTYPTMPTIRIYAMDDQDFLFSWHPLGRLSNQNVCFHVSDSIATRGVVEELRNEITNIAKISSELAVLERGKGIVKSKSASESQFELGSSGS